MYFPTRNLDTQNLTSTVWKAIAAFQSCGITVICLIADGLSTNRKMFEQMRNLDNCSHQCVNIYNPEIPLFLIVDPPHLLKTTRNCIYASLPTGSRLLKFDEHCILWSLFTKAPYLYETADLLQYLDVLHGRLLGSHVNFHWQLGGHNNHQPCSSNDISHCSSSQVCTELDSAVSSF